MKDKYLIRVEYMGNVNVKAVLCSEDDVFLDAGKILNCEHVDPFANYFIVDNNKYSFLTNSDQEDYAGDVIAKRVNPEQQTYDYLTKQEAQKVINTLYVLTGVL